MKSEFLNKFKGKTNKISKLGINKLLNAFNDSHIQSYNVQKVDPKVLVLMQNSLNKQNIDKSNVIKNKKKNISYSFSQLKAQANKQFQYKQRQVITVKQSNSYKQNLQKKQKIKLPKIGKSIQTNNYNLLNESKIKKIQAQKRQRRNNTQTNEDKFFYFGTFLNHDVHQQLDKLNQFQNRIKSNLNSRNSEIQNDHQTNSNQINKYQSNKHRIDTHQMDRHKRKGISYHY